MGKRSRTDEEINEENQDMNSSSQEYRLSN